MGQRIYGFGTHSGFTNPDAPFTAIRSAQSAGILQAWLIRPSFPPGITLLVAVQDDIKYLYSEQGPVLMDLLFEIPGSNIPGGATGISVTMGLAALDSDPLGPTTGTFLVASTGFPTSFSSWTAGFSNFTENTSSSRTLDADGVTLTTTTLLSNIWGFRASVPFDPYDPHSSVNKFALKVTWTDPPPGTGLTSTQAIGKTARFGVARFGASRFGAAPDKDNLDATGTYRWKRNSPNSPIAAPTPAVVDSWTITRPS